ncbi:M1 family metallopeptidase [Ferruginibacter sp. SUN106]|uniref:M1 family metallopeptidase n=1 Tax=Ferruginibacter sp. SUN106 TaxID=2978348 RepID=UPI003D36BB9D
MKKTFFLLALTASPFLMMAQDEDAAPVKDTSWKKVYRATSTKINDLVHTKLDVKFDYAKAWMYGKEWLTLKPHFYATDSLTLDAKGMDIKEIAMMKGAAKSPLKYTYDGWQLRINLDKTYKAGENYTIYIDYTSKPNEVKVKGSAAINDAKGLYFINPTGEDKDKPTQIWTQGETEANSVWMPTIDKPNQKTTDEIYMTVPAKYVTLSNGLLISQKKNADGTRTDYWKMDLPHSPYLFFMGVGDFAIIKDSYKGKEVSYYVEKEQAPYARGVFGLTPEMMKFYSDKLGVEYPWQKYNQIVGRDYVSGAMENTTATLHQESAYQNARQLTEGNSWETVICHELFHQWFGDLVTTESWSNITVNESMADYSQTLWMEYKHGKDAGDEENFQGLAQYLSDSNSAKKNLVRFYYSDKEDVFDLVSYQKGGRVLHMLRNYVGDDAFFKSLNNYLNTNKFKNGESDQMRLAFEEVTGQDLSWYWNQWYFGNGHPKLKIDYVYKDGKASVIIEQTQNTGKIFKLPIAIDIYTGAQKVRHNVWVENQIDTFTFSYTQKPDLINVDGDKILLCEKKDNKTAENFIHQMKYAPLFIDRREALQYFAKNNMKELTEGLKDKYAPLREYTINKIVAGKLAKDADVVKAVEALAAIEKNKKTKAAALQFLAATGDSKYLQLFKTNVGDSSYSVAGAALGGLAALEPANAYALAKKYSTDAKGDLSTAVTDIIMSNGTEADFDLVAGSYDKSPLSQEKVGASATFAAYLEKVQNLTNVKKGIDMIMKFRNLVPEQFRGFVDPTIKGGLDKLGKAKGAEIADYIKGEWK